MLNCATLTHAVESPIGIYLDRKLCGCARVELTVVAPTAAQSERDDGSSTLRVKTTVGGEPVELDVRPEAIPDLLLFAYASGGREQYNALGRSILNSTTDRAGAARFGLEALLPTTVPRRNDAVSALALSIVTQTREALEDAVVLELHTIVDDAYAIAKKRLAATSAELERQYTRYALDNPDSPSAAGTDLPSGSDLAATATADAEQLVGIVTGLVSLRNATDRIRLDELERAGVHGLSAAGGAPGDGASKNESLSPAALARIQQAEEKFRNALIVPRNGKQQHPIAPTVLALVASKFFDNEKKAGDLGVGREDILRAALYYLSDGRRRLVGALPPQSLGAGAASFARLSAAKRLEKAGRVAQDTPETRVALWARRPGQEFGYEPADDEGILMKLLEERAAPLAAATEPLAQFQALFRYQVLAELIGARDAADAIEAAEAAEAMPNEALMTRATVLDLLGLLVPPVGLAGLTIQVYVLAASTLAALDSMRTTDAKIDSAVIGALLEDDGAKALMLLNSKPSLAGLLGPLLVEGISLTAMGALANGVSRGTGIAFQVLLDLKDLGTAAFSPEGAP